VFLPKFASTIKIGRVRMEITHWVICVCMQETRPVCLLKTEAIGRLWNKKMIVYAARDSTRTKRST
jgi:hypothetical protein